MASNENGTTLSRSPPQRAGVKRTRTREHETPRKSVRLEQSIQKEPLLAGDGRNHSRHDSSSGVCEDKRTPQQQKSVSPKRPQTQNDPVAREDASHERRKECIENSAFVPALPSNLSDGDGGEHPIAHWAARKQWPRQYFEQDKDMENILARKRSSSARSRKNSDADSATPSLTDQGEPKSREQKSAEYNRPQYETVLATKGVSMKRSPRGVTTASKDWCKDLLQKEQNYPENTLFRDDLFDSTCESIRNRNETRVIRDIAPLLVPSAEVFTIRGATHLEGLIDSVNEGWNNSISITKTRPQPDYAVGFRREAFTQEQLDRMHPIIGDFNDQSYFMATWYMYFPFLTCEVKCGAASLEIADRQNAHSTAIAVRAVVELFRAVKREKELHREILAFSISHDDRIVRIYGYYAEVADSATKYYRYPIHAYAFTALDGREKWTSYKFTKNVYENWMPMHFKRICSAIDQIPADISFSVSQSEIPFSEQASGLPQDLTAYSIARSSAGSAAAQPQDDAQSSEISGAVDTPSSSVHETVFKKPRREPLRRAGQ